METPIIIIIGCIVILVLSGIVALVWQVLQEYDGSPASLNEAVSADNNYTDPRLIVTDSFVEDESHAEAVVSDPTSFQSGISYAQRELFSGSVPPQESPVDNSYFDTAFFLGDMFTAGISPNLSAFLSSFHVVGKEDLTLNTALEYKGYEGENKQPATFLDLAKGAGTFQTVYIMIGRSDTSLSGEEFTEKYAAFVLAVKALFPDAIVYLQGIIPALDPQANKLILERNLLIMNIAADSGAYFLDTSSVFSDDEGLLLRIATPDGNYITGEFYYRWLDYIKHHIL